MKRLVQAIMPGQAAVEAESFIDLLLLPVRGHAICQHCPQDLSSLGHAPRGSRSNPLFLARPKLIEIIVLRSNLVKFRRNALGNLGHKLMYDNLFCGFSLAPCGEDFVIVNCHYCAPCPCGAVVGEPCGPCWACCAAACCIAIWCCCAACCCAIWKSIC